MPRFLHYVKTETRPDAASTTIPLTQARVAFAQTLKKELEELGISDVIYNEANGSMIATLPSNVRKDARSIDFIAHMDTTDFNAVNVSPQIVKNYDGESAIPLDKEGKFTLSMKGSPNLKNYRGETPITIDGTTSLRADDKSGIAGIMTAARYLINHPGIRHGTIRATFDPDKKIGAGANRFNVAQSNVDFVYTMDGGPIGGLQLKTFNTAQAEITIQGKNVHLGVARSTMINALQLGIDSRNALPAGEVPEKTTGEGGFYHLAAFAGVSEGTTMMYIIRSHNCGVFETRRTKIKEIQQILNAPFDEERIEVDLSDQYYNMREVVGKDMFIVEIVKQTMEELPIQPVTEPVRGETDGSKASYLGVPTPDTFIDGEDIHGRFEFISLQVMEKMINVIIKTTELNTR